MNERQQLESLQEMLMWRRPGGTRAERKFIKKYILPLGVQQDGYGNLIKRIGDAPVLWSCHTDTVHKEGGLQAVEMKDGWFSLTNTKASNCLGADDTVGVWLMAEMIKRNVSGLYVFHREEESGAGGSLFIAENTPALLADIKCAIALDRKGKNDVITHQFGRCCSDTFAKSLSFHLNGSGHGFLFQPNSNGVFTDTANYVDHIGECTNLSVGYCGQHSSHETQHGEHALKLLEALSHLDSGQLEFERKPGEKSADDWGDWSGTPYGSGSAYDRYHKVAKAWDVWSDEYEQAPKSAADLETLVRHYPQETADYIDAFGGDAAGELWEHIASVRGWRR